MNSFYCLLEGLNNYVLENNHWPKVKISPAFWAENAGRISLLRKDGIKFEVEESLSGKFCFVIAQPPAKTMNEGTGDELMRYISLFISEVKGEKPILNMHPKDLQTNPN